MAVHVASMRDSPCGQPMRLACSPCCMAALAGMQECLQHTEPIAHGPHVNLMHSSGGAGQGAARKRAGSGSWGGVQQAWG